MSHKDNIEWLTSLSNDERARILLPFIKLHMHPNKPWKCDIRQATREEYAKIFAIICSELEK